MPDEQKAVGLQLMRRAVDIAELDQHQSKRDMRNAISAFRNGGEQCADLMLRAQVLLEQVDYEKDLAKFGEAEGEGAWKAKEERARVAAVEFARVGLMNDAEKSIRLSRSPMDTKVFKLVLTCTHTRAHT